MHNRPVNLVVCDEPDYKVRIINELGDESYFEYYGKSSWKRLSAVCHARTFARRNPTLSVLVVLAGDET